MDVIEALCKQYTDLTEEEIGIIKGMSMVLQPLANLEDADIFVDCPASEGRCDCRCGGKAAECAVFL